MWAVRVFLMLVLAFGLSACGSKFKTYNGPEVTRVEVHKADRKMYLLHNTEVLEVYDIKLGFNPVGHKQFEGDGKTPEGSYRISHKNPRSRYHLSLGMSYPNENDVAFAQSMGKVARRRHHHPRPHQLSRQEQGRLDRRLHRRAEQGDGADLRDGEARDADPDPALSAYCSGALASSGAEAAELPVIIVHQILPFGS